MENQQAQVVIKEIKKQIEGKKITKKEARFIKNYLVDYKSLVYFLIFDPIENRGVGFVNQESFANGAQFIDAMIRGRGMHFTFENLKNTFESPNEYIKLQQDYWVDKSMQVRYAYLNPVNYFRWGIRSYIVTWGFYIWYFLGLCFSAFYFFGKINRPQLVESEAVSSSLIEEKKNMEFLQKRAQEQIEKDLVQDVSQVIFSEADAEYEEEVEDDDTKVDDIPSQVWIRLLDEPDLKDWEVKGSFYVRGDKKGLHAIGFPWASSIVTRKEVIFPEFIFEAEARVLTGQEGFAVLFRVGKYYLTWVLGGWENSRSEVLGIESTKTFHQIHHKKWYHIRIEQENQEVIGYIDGRTAWTIATSEIVHDSPDVGFQKGLGVGVWNTTSKFRNIRVLKV
ncbi:MAG: hypothetical protein KDD46_03000 [Bdellovibrionales bacterium]|nr:hypothetical protein [Bdellovibrionales bacterium]